MTGDDSSDRLSLKPADYAERSAAARPLLGALGSGVAAGLALLPPHQRGRGGPERRGERGPPVLLSRREES